MTVKYLAQVSGGGRCKSLRIKNTTFCFMFTKLFFPLAFLIAFFFLLTKKHVLSPVAEISHLLNQSVD